tara:strand:- start:1768 stop:3171 length:1404 start_codon:yes stop_codon:yes gene_type:complete
MYEYKTQPFEHQRKALAQGADRKAFAYLMEMGTGKTKVTLDNAAYLYLGQKINLMVVVAPNSVYQNWKDEISLHCPCDTNVFTYKIDKYFKYVEDKLNVVLMNVEAFSHKSGVTYLEDILKSYGDRSMMIIDESTTIKNRTAKRTKALIRLGKMTKYRRILTGSPITKSPLDLFSQFQFLGTDLLGTDNFYIFRAKYCVMMEINLAATNRKVSIPKFYINLDELEKKIKEHSFRVLKKDCLDLKPKIYTKRIVTLKPQQAAAYKELADHARTIIFDDQISYNNKLTEVLKLRELTDGFYTTDTGEKKDLPSAKLEELLNVLEETEGKVIIWTNFIRTLERIITTLQKKYGTDSTVAIYGKIPAKDRPEVIDRFQNNNAVRFLIGNPQTAGYGLNLTSANTVIYYSNSFNLEERQQSEDRAHRAGQTGSVLYIDLIVKGTVDEMIIKSLKNKIQISAKTLGEEILEYL